MSELTTWLRAQILERKKTAEAAAETPRPDWTAITRRGKKRMVGIIEATTNMQPSRRWLFNAETEATNVLHIAFNDPQDTIARCEAELALLDLHEPIVGDRANYTIAEQNRAEDVMLILASGYRHRPGWQERWRLP